MVRMSVVLPAPFGPVSISASPADTANERPEKTMRSPRSDGQFVGDELHLHGNYAWPRRITIMERHRV